MPRCPVCRVQCDPISYEGTRIYNCGSCGGHWLSAARLDVILSRREITMPEPVQQKMMDIADASNSTQRLLCMTCGCEMVKEAFRYWDDIQIDRCRKCGGIWLDKGELEKCQIYWEYAQDHPEQWENADTITRKALLCAQLDQQRRDLRRRADEINENVRRWRPNRGGVSIAHVLAAIFGR